MSAFDASITADQTVSGNTICATVNEGNLLVLVAPPGDIIASITFASYGTPLGSCGAFAVGPCNAPSSLSVVEGACVGRSSCVITADTATFGGDPCPGTTKQLFVQATVGPQPTPTRTNTWGELKVRYR